VASQLEVLLAHFMS